MDQPIVFVHGRTDAAATAAALALVGWGRGRQAIPGGRPGWSGRPVIAGEDADGRLVVAAGRGPDAAVASRTLAALFGLAGLHGRLVLHDAETGQATPLGPPARGDGPVIVYACPGSAYAAVAAAAVHTGLLPADRVPRWRELGTMPMWRTLPGAEPGAATYVGCDGTGRPVYGMGLGSAHDLLRRLSQRSLRKLLTGPLPVLFVSTAAQAHPLTRLGGQLADFWPLARIGGPLALWGVLRAYRQLAGVAADTQRELGRTQSGRLAAGVDPGQAISHTGWQESRTPSGPPQPPAP